MGQGLYGIEATNILLEDLSYDQESLELVRKLDSELVAMKYNTIEIEERRARNELSLRQPITKVMAMV